MAAKLAVAAAAKATNPVMLALESGAALKAATKCGAQKEVLAAAKTRAAADVGNANGHKLHALNDAGGQAVVLAGANTLAAPDVGNANSHKLHAISAAGGKGLVLAGAKTQSYEELEAANARKRYALIKAGALEELTPLYTNMTLPQLSLAKVDDWRAAQACHLNDKLFRAGMQASDDELLEYNPGKLQIFIVNDPGRGNSVIRYMEALAKKHGADAGAVEGALLQLDMKTLKLFANSHRLRIALEEGSWNDKQSMEANRQVLAQVLAQVVAEYSSGGTWQQNESVPVAGQLIEVLWEDDNTFYRGKCVGYDGSSGKHSIKYEDGSMESIQFQQKGMADGDGATVWRLTWQGCVAAAVAKDPCLAVNVVGKGRNATEEETATLRHYLGNANGVLDDVEWADLTAALAQVTNYERNWNRGHSYVRGVAREIKQLQGKKRKRASAS
jgi:hypothetical protein